MDSLTFSATQAIQAIVAPAVMISSCALLFLGLSARYVAIITRVRLLNDEKRQLLYQLIAYPTGQDRERRLLNIDRQLQILVRLTWFVRNAILCQITAVTFFVLACFAIGIEFLAGIMTRNLPLYLFSLGMLAVLSGVTFMGCDIFNSYRIIQLEVSTEDVQPSVAFDSPNSDKSHLPKSDRSGRYE
ncbi:DUF2721 domain-containing protein [Desertifilum sp. FACHB-1129]|uniref:DUF2721 domain-containing protein n=1 Tax=Desertifilum tharense IPPAS B-1220 TaxID=1781255 RepID=A0A1E5QQ65_9CYAN|nr:MULTISPECIES: DUF2721 domain-containing protein [Desertifilum]MDA0209168.1 DUF2721 domain-containing protein [Cyanobacteria bacterium FC1]MBD2311822.1 DUF2721 domain-containing protein [Desertifilum sp. FACHB-1129]MBD2322966.1 DUF2721 domain-containing protein [Desertifilum sp. FACHB-866]MBD2333397.1 DUF2721 domain-containing protein [Desertifilum sp. FACHB-868]OEJ76809.1 hypothetical protein BH720_02195 [Desertifilum tharense IPPAS B-1220]